MGSIFPADGHYRLIKNQIWRANQHGEAHVISGSATPYLNVRSLRDHNFGDPSTSTDNVCPIATGNRSLRNGACISVLIALSSHVGNGSDEHCSSLESWWHRLVWLAQSDKARVQQVQRRTVLPQRQQWHVERRRLCRGRSCAELRRRCLLLMNEEDQNYIYSLHLFITFITFTLQKTKKNYMPETESKKSWGWIINRKTGGVYRSAFLVVLFWHFFSVFLLSQTIGTKREIEKHQRHRWTK